LTAPVLLRAKLRDTYVNVMVALGGSGDAVPYVLARSRAAVRRLGYEQAVVVHHVKKSRTHRLITDMISKTCLL